MWALDFLAKYGFALSFGFQFLVAGALLLGRDKFAPKSLSKEFHAHKQAMQDQHHIFDKRISKVEDDLNDLPNIQEFHDLKLQMCNLTGELKRVDETLEGFKDHLRRTEKQYNLIDQYLRSQK